MSSMATFYLEKKLNKQQLCEVLVNIQKLLSDFGISLFENNKNLYWSRNDPKFINTYQYYLQLVNLHSNFNSAIITGHIKEGKGNGFNIIFDLEGFIRIEVHQDSFYMRNKQNILEFLGKIISIIGPKNVFHDYQDVMISIEEFKANKLFEIEFYDYDTNEIIDLRLDINKLLKKKIE